MKLNLIIKKSVIPKSLQLTLGNSSLSCAFLCSKRKALEYLDTFTMPPSQTRHLPQTLPSLPPPQGKNTARQNLSIMLKKRPENGLPARGETFCPMHAETLSLFCAAARSQTLNTNFWKTSGRRKLKSLVAKTSKAIRDTLPFVCAMERLWLNVLLHTS